MTEATIASRSVTIERELPHPPEKIWRALTEGHLMEEWLMKNDFAPRVGHRFTFTADWGAVTGEVMVVEPHHTLAYSWGAYGVETTVTWTLTPTKAGTHLRMEQAGFRADQEQAYQGALAGWPRFMDALEKVVSK